MAEREPSIVKKKSSVESSLAKGVPIGPPCWTGYSVNQREGSMRGGATYHVNTMSETKVLREQVDGTNGPFLFFTFPIYLMLDLFWLLKVMHQMRWKIVTWYKNFQRRGKRAMEQWQQEMTKEFRSKRISLVFLWGGGGGQPKRSTLIGV